MTRPGVRPLIAGNWKMHLTHLEAIAHVQKLSYTLGKETPEKAEVAVIPAFTALRSVQTLIDSDRMPVALGAQDISPHDQGAYTGEVSGSMLSALGCQYVVVGHSERRAHHRETDDVINAKMRAVLKVGLTPILCVGEDAFMRTAHAYIQHTLAQLVTASVGIDPAKIGEIVIAYEPVWAIGTGKVATPHDAQEMSLAIRRQLSLLFGDRVAVSVRVLYGGSVNPVNAREILMQPDVDGALVGSVSLKPEDFTEVCVAAAGLAS